MSKGTPPTTPDRISAAEIRELFADLRARVQQIKGGLSTAAAPTQDSYREMVIEKVLMSYDDKGQPTYKATGAPYRKFGVRIWPETLPALGIDPATLKPGPNELQQPIAARVLMATDDEGKTNARKVVGKV